MSAPTKQAPRRSARRRWFQFSIASLLLLMVATGVLFGYVANHRRELERERQSIAAIEEIGGKCETALRGPAWLGRLADKKSSTRVVSVDLSFQVVAFGMTDHGCIAQYSLNRQVTDEWLSNLAGLRHLETLNLHGNEITAQGLALLRHFPGLRSLDLSGCSIDDHALEAVGRLSGLRQLSLLNTKVSHNGLRHIGLLAGLTDLDIGPCAGDGEPVAEFPTAGLEHLQGCVHLERLYLSGMFLSDEGIQALRPLPTLIELDMRLSRVSSSGLRRLRDLTSLEAYWTPLELQPDELREIYALQQSRPTLKIHLPRFTPSLDAPDLPAAEAPMPDGAPAEVPLPQPKAPSPPGFSG